jgi:arginase
MIHTPMTGPVTLRERPAAARSTYVGAPLNLGCPTLGVEEGPAAVWRRLQERAAHRRYDPQLAPVRGLQRVDVPLPDYADVTRRLGSPPLPHEHPAYLAALADASERIAAAVGQAVLATPHKPLVVVGGDHTVAVGAVAGLRRVHQRVGLLWIDAHADLNTWDESPSRRVHGMAAAAAIGRTGAPPALLDVAPVGPKVAHDALVYLGLRDLDWGEKAYLARHPEILALTMDDAEQYGMARLAERIVDHFARLRLEVVHVSLDVDALDPSVAPGTGVRVSSGLAERELLFLLARLREEAGRVPFHSLEVAEVNPRLDQDGRTVDLAARLIARFLGETVLGARALPRAPYVAAVA